MPTTLARPPAAVCFDGFGTLFHLGDGAPARAVCERLRALGYVGSQAAVADGLRAEFAYYRSRHKFVRDRAQLTRLQERCGQIVLDGLDSEDFRIDPLTVGRVIAAVFPPRLYADTVGALERAKAAGLRVGVLSNYSYLLRPTLQELAIESLFDFVVVSALEGVAKPDPAIFSIARCRAGVGERPIAHIGNSLEEDYLGAQRAGFGAVLLDRGGAGAAGTVSARDLNGALEILL